MFGIIQRLRTMVGAGNQRDDARAGADASHDVIEPRRNISPQMSTAQVRRYFLNAPQGQWSAHVPAPHAIATGQVAAVQGSCGPKVASVRDLMQDPAMEGFFDTGDCTDPSVRVAWEESMSTLQVDQETRDLWLRAKQAGMRLEFDGLDDGVPCVIPTSDNEIYAPASAAKGELATAAEGELIFMLGWGGFRLDDWDGADCEGINKFYRGALERRQGQEAAQGPAATP